MNKLKEFLGKVYEINGFYQNIVKTRNIINPLDITQYPILTRQQLQENRYNMFSEGYMSKYSSQQLRKQSSSGSYGIPVNVYWDYKDYYSSMRILWHKRLEYYGIHPSDRYVMFTLNAFNAATYNDKVYYIIEPNNILNINMSSVQENNDYENLLNLIDEFNPKWLYIQPFILQRLVYFYETTGKTPPLTIKYIESVGELLSSELKQKACEFFNVPVGNLYGSEEMNGIAYECPYNHMHILSNNVLVECLDSNGIHGEGEGEAIITSLTNKAMPLIRYNQEDRIIIENLLTPCLCGSSEPFISRINGRAFNSIRIGDIELNSFLLLETMAEINNQYNSIMTAYRYVYNKSERKLKCLIKLDESKLKWFQSVKNAVEDVFWKKIASSINIDLEVILDESIISHDGKHKVFKIED